ncbi:MAG: hypothetical protein A2289_25240 [Deltaproteobacteria bacterium RIFOXYA12_FULL_58_15]|nr:MAG: hypothetical protein A2289_25240 [Deltaproteobacteria bacterium RIFOXYA12_FULL_58_15]OGR14161.1 MAG: hypothetical protein A2341_26640 [Deltaproteobacteria bacterium RIFOXYB12_FULL_58_9]
MVVWIGWARRGAPNDPRGMSSIPVHSILLIEDVDCFFDRRKAATSDNSIASSHPVSGQVVRWNVGPVRSLFV